MKVAFAQERNVKDTVIVLNAKDTIVTKKKF